MIIVIIIFAQDIEVLNLQGKIDAMTREREQISKESGQIMDEVCIKMNDNDDDNNNDDDDNS